MQKINIPITTETGLLNEVKAFVIGGDNNAETTVITDMYDPNLGVTRDVI